MTCLEIIKPTTCYLAAVALAIVTFAHADDVLPSHRTQAAATASESKVAAPPNPGATSAPLQADNAKGDSDRSKAQPYMSYGCYQCHGYAGQGGGAGPRLTAEMPFEAFKQIVRFPYGVMPAYPSELLTDEVLASIYAYIEKLPLAKDITELPLLYDTSK